jgi:arylsulfatase A-like enzyme
MPCSRSLLAAALAPVALLLAACEPPARGSAASEARPNLILVSFDSLRADHLGAYGYARDTSPNLDRFASQAVLFERAYSTSSWTLPAHASMLSSLYPEEHGASGPRKAISEGVALLPEALAAAGYRSRAVVSVGLLHRLFGFAQGWELYDDETAVPPGEVDPERRRTSAVVGRRAAQMLDALGDGPFFLFLHDYDVHFDYQPPPPYDTMFEPARVDGFDPSNFAFNDTIHRDMPKAHLERLVALYDGEIRWVDHNFGLLMAELERRGLAENTLVVVVGDHGEEFFEHGEKGHQNNLYNTSLQVPMLVRFPGRRHAGTRVSTPVSLVDVAPTLTAAAGVAPDPSWSGIDVATLLDEDAAHRAPRWLHAELTQDSGRALRAAVYGRRKGIVSFDRRDRPSGYRALFDVVADPDERHDRQALPESAERMAAIVARIRREVATFERTNERLGSGWVQLDAERAAELRALGYL